MSFNCYVFYKLICRNVFWFGNWLAIIVTAHKMHFPDEMLQTKSFQDNFAP